MSRLSFPCCTWSSLFLCCSLWTWKAFYYLQLAVSLYPFIETDPFALSPVYSATSGHPIWSLSSCFLDLWSRLLLSAFSAMWVHVFLEVCSTTVKAIFPLRLHQHQAKHNPGSLCKALLAWLESRLSMTSQVGQSVF